MKWPWVSRTAFALLEKQVDRWAGQAERLNALTDKMARRNFELNRELDTLRASARTSPRRFALLFANKDGEWQAEVCNEIGRSTKSWGVREVSGLAKGYNYGEAQWCSMTEFLDEDGAGFLRSIREWPLP